jgi:hypothetical protein
MCAGIPTARELSVFTEVRRRRILRSSDASFVL